MKILLIRFSSFGDVTQCLSVPSALVKAFPQAEIHWVTRRDFVGLLGGHPAIHKVWSFDRKSGLRGLLRLSKELRLVRFDRIYDAHNNLRSRFLCLLLQAPFAMERLTSQPALVRRSVKRWKRLMLFRFRKNLFEMPFAGQRDLLEPLEVWGVPRFPPPPAPQLFITDQDRAAAQGLLGEYAAGFVALAASAAHALKRWPIEHWKNLVQLMPQQRFVLLGGPEDEFFKEIVAIAPDRILNLAGRSSLAVSAAVVDLSRGLITNDTGLLHVAEQRGKPAVALMGPAPFGFPCRPSTKVLELNLSCRPCSKHGQGPCVNEKFHRCMVDLLPSDVVRAAQGQGMIF